MSDVRPEPWLRDTIHDLHPALAAVLYSFEHADEDLTQWTDGLSTDQIWTSPAGLASVGFHIRHIAGSIDRLITYALDLALSEEQLRALSGESEPGASRDELLAQFRMYLAAASAKIRGIHPDRFEERRFVGRKRLPVTTLGLLVHMAEHTQRHVGQAIVTCKLVR